VGGGGGYTTWSMGWIGFILTEIGVKKADRQVKVWESGTVSSLPQEGASVKANLK